MAFVTGKRTVIRASSSDVPEPAAPIAPLQLEDAEKDKEEPSASGTDLVLYRRIAEVKANDRRKALEEILYALVVQKFMDANVSLVPAIAPPSSSDPSGRVDTWPSEDEKLERLHSPEAYEMIQNHLALILGNRLGDSSSVAQISKLRVGQVYAASVMYGYFLKRVDQRFQLEKTMKILPQGTGTSDSVKSEQSHPELSSWAGGVSSPGGFGYGIKPSRLRTYVMPEITITPEGTIDASKDEIINISFGGLRRLVLEAVTFGSFLWDVESYVDSRYHFVAN
ncbi:alanine-tRNA ligase, putative [Actinidia rufa]|uniref:Alanine-tRNA ligase, putative n=1 Tax=Actinidia rufa TaxID=165716 RepID=A0A7J0G9Z7_9ERIC|nr:alanine-tRNA ligase, putative [Actinidia rufa]